MTRWAASVSPTNVLPEYPRPQLVRERWQSLNGLWDYVITEGAVNIPASWTNQILVPFPLESLLSGVERPLGERSTLWYRRRFTLPPAWRHQPVLLHFGAVDWAAEVFLNGRRVGSHEGGYDAFSFDVTAALQQEGQNELVVAVTDPTEGDQPRGKQSRKPEGIFYTASSGIWQTPWLEPVPPVRINELSLVPDFGSPAVRALVLANAGDRDLRAEVLVSFAGQAVGQGEGSPGSEIVVPLHVARPWTPAQPSLYDVQVRLKRGPEVLDRVSSYFGLREVRVATDEFGVRRIFLNGKPLFLVGVLDQGFWPDGLYTAPSDAALRYDLQTAKRLGFNLVRKHVKVEPDRWYYWADRLGLLVWQDMPSGNNATETGRAQFETELQRLVRQLGNHPCIVQWVLFNEGWGQFDTERLAHRVKVADPTRLVDDASGWTDLKVGDVLDLHSYPNPIAPPTEPTRAKLLGEFGGLGFGVEGHTWSQQTWGYRGMADCEKLTRQYCLLWDQVWELHKSHGLAAAVYTQLTDVETECNGFLTYDRAVLKMDATQVNHAHRCREDASGTTMLLPDARFGEFPWHFTTNAPPAGWTEPDFSPRGWQTGMGGFGTRMAPGVNVRTDWVTSGIWLRREFVLPESFRPAAALSINHDEDAEIYLNGVPVASFPGFTVGYMEFQLPTGATRALRPGRNVLAIHCRQTTGGQYIDAGLLAEPQVPEPDPAGKQR